MLFICDIDNRVVAECGRFIYAPDEGNAYFFVNIYGDDTAELICNTQYSDGAERVKIYWNSNGIIEIGGVNETYICDEFGIVQLESPGSIKEVYDPERNLIVVTLYESELDHGQEGAALFPERADRWSCLAYQFLYHPPTGNRSRHANLRHLRCAV